ncbi:MAG: CcoQ/FixQ family Cbb3-type cytochrome c oxidase assembly chaperone [Gammaproteobacteria bacterium]|nr:CcoQ/FixQ family Cbb3-type cytochrome c oxidase assembly chaperone [Gammaproteobacteria bacterium]
MGIGIVHGVWSLFILLAFAGIVAWAWSGKRRHFFEEAGRIPFLAEDEDRVNRADHDHE